MTAQELIKKYQGESAYLHEDDAIAFAEEFALIQILPEWPVFQPIIKEDIKQLRGKNLACFCPLDKSCHADLLLEIANR